jgi:hypothetical protein
VLKAARQGGSNSSVVNDPVVEPDRTPLYVGRSSAWGSVGGDLIFYPHFVGELLNWDSERYERMNKPLALETEHL